MSRTKVDPLLGCLIDPFVIVGKGCTRGCMRGCVLIFLFPVVFLVGATRNAIKRSRRKVVNPSAYKDIVK